MKSIVARANRGSSSPVRSMRPVAGHAEVRVEHATVVEHEQLMFPRRSTARTSRAAQRAERAGESRRERRVQHVDARESLSDRGVANATHGALDLG